MAQSVPVKHETCTLHAKAKQLIPPSDGIKPSTIWVGVLRFDSVPIDDLTSEDFLWIKAKGSILTRKIHEAFQQKYEAVLKDDDWILEFQGKGADLSTTLADLNTHNDNCIIFEATKAPKSIPATRQPLQPINPRAFQPKSPSLMAIPSTIDVKPNTIYEKHPPANGISTDKTIPTLASQPPPRGVFRHDPRSFPNSANYHQPSGFNSQLGPQQGFMAPQHGMLMPQGLYNGITPMANVPQPANQPRYLPSATTRGFKTFELTFLNDAKKHLPQASTAEIQQDLFDKWCRLPAEGRAYYEQSSVSDIPIQQASFDTPVPAIKAEATVNADERSKVKEDSSAYSEPIASSAEIEGEGRQDSFQLQDLFKDARPEMLERSVEEGVNLLDDLKGPLIEKMAEHPDAEQWLQQIDNLKKQAVKTRTVIGVVGNTGAGKSSVINAILDEERLVPTNCMRACTAVVTEISYNYEVERYRAEIEFIKPADWEKELKTLFEDLFDGEGKISRDCTNENTDAGIAYAKIKAVYPQKTREDIANSSPEKMLREVAHILGTTKFIKEDDSLLFYKKLQNYVDSKEKSTGKKEKPGDKKKEPKQIEFWPLIRVVRINVKSPALATGAVIVDLPGVHDANAARAAVAEGYMKQCTGLWIVAPINRAVDDKAAKSLLGESFKRQLKMDGGFSAVTFICSKTDDISLEEAQDTLGLEDQFATSWEEMDGLVKKQRSLNEQVKEIQGSKTVYGEAMNDADDQIEIWDGLKEDLERGKIVFPPKAKAKSNKRKAHNKDRASKKRRRADESGSEDDEPTDDGSDQSADEDDNDNSTDDSEQPHPLTEEQIAAKLQELKATKREARARREEITEQIRTLKQVIEEAKEAENKIHSQLSALCISGRNQYSKGAIQQDFAAGIKEIDQELAAEEDEENFNPDVETRDYDEVAHGLPVFCVSSRGYQKLQGRLKKDPHVPGFTNIDETEIPQLQAHCEKLTETGRSANCRSFMNKLSQLLNSLVLWASSDGTGANLSPEQRAKEDKNLLRGLRSLETGLEDAVNAACHELDAEITENIYDRYETAVSDAAEASANTALHWGSRVNRDNRQEGGYFWATYKAICRRNGVYSNAQGHHDWNAQFADPMIKILASGWEKTFSRRLPMVTASFTRDTAKRLRSFHQNIEARARKLGTNVASLHMLQQQVGVYESNVKDIAGAMKDKITAIQKDINREFTPVIERAMEAAYTICTEERGTGSFARMKEAMNRHVASKRHVMFQRSVDHVKARLDAMIKEVKETLDDKFDEIFIQVRRDYRSVFGGDVSKEGQILPKAQRLARKEVLHIIEGCERRFNRIAGVDVEDDEDNDGMKTKVKKEQKDADIAGIQENEDTELTGTNEAGDSDATGKQGKLSELVQDDEDQASGPSSPAMSADTASSPVASLSTSD